DRGIARELGGAAPYLRHLLQRALAQISDEPLRWIGPESEFHLRLVSGQPLEQRASLQPACQERKHRPDAQHNAPAQPAPFRSRAGQTVRGKLSVARPYSEGRRLSRWVRV